MEFHAPIPIEDQHSSLAWSSGMSLATGQNKSPTIGTNAQVHKTKQKTNKTDEVVDGIYMSNYINKDFRLIL